MADPRLSPDPTRVVADLLLARKGRLSEAPRPVLLPDLSEAAPTIVQRLGKTSFRKNHEDVNLRGISGASPSSFPGVEPVDLPKNTEEAPEFSSRIEETPRPDPFGPTTTGPSFDPGSIFGSFPPTPSIRPEGDAPGPSIEAVAARPTSAGVVDPGFDLKGHEPHTPPIPSDRGQGTTAAPGLVAPVSSFAINPRLQTPTVDLPREPVGGASTSGLPGAIDPTGLDDRRSTTPGPFSASAGSSRGVAPSAHTVRNPLSANLRNLAMADSAGPEVATGQPDPVAGGPAAKDDAWGGSGSPSGGSSLDLSKTNELLQQLLDAVRKQRNTALPVGGPSAYPDR